MPAADVFDARGNLRRSNIANSVLGINNSYDPISGKAFRLRAGTAGGGYVNALDHEYWYDKANNVAHRNERINAVAETFGYDRLDRLTSFVVDSGSDNSADRTVTLQYNAIGNITRKSDNGGTYAYHTNRPHAISSDGNTSYTYDNNGNLTSTAGAQVRANMWTAFNQPASLSHLGRTVAFTYDHDFQRVREVITNGSTQHTIHMLHPDNQGGLLYEREETRVSGVLTRNEHRHYISVGGTTLAVVKTLDGSSKGILPADVNMVNYWHKDALGSVVAVTNKVGAVLERMSFDPWGRRQRNTGVVDASVDPVHGDRGYTGHEHLDEVALVHMNGRLYDPKLARFLSPDPVVGAPTDLQTYNRYSYVYNQPLRYADPSGNCPICAVAFFAGTVMAYDGNKYWSIVGRVMQLWGGMTMLGDGVALKGGLSAFGGEGMGLLSAEGASFGSAFGSGLVNGDGLEQSLISGAFAATLLTLAASLPRISPNLSHRTCCWDVLRVQRPAANVAHRQWPRDSASLLQ